MVRRARLAPAPRWLLTTVILLLVLGHACEPPAYAQAMVSSHPTPAGGHPADGDHGHDPQISCEPVEATASAASVHLLKPGGDGPPVIAGPSSVWPIPSSLEDFRRLARRPPLFLLHASLLI